MEYTLDWIQSKVFLVESLSFRSISSRYSDWRE